MITLQATPGPELRAQLVGMGCAVPQYTLLGDLVPVTTTSVRYTPTPDSAPKAGDTNYSTTTHAGPVPCACADGTTGMLPRGATACVCAKKTNWALYGGLALGAVVLIAFLKS